MKKLTIVLAVVASAGSVMAATAAKWAWPTGATTFENAADWDTGANWAGSAKPAAKGDSATFTTTDSLVNWIRIPVAGTGAFSTLTANSGNGTSYFFGGPINLANPSSGAASVLASKSEIFSDINLDPVGGMVYFDTETKLYGKMNASFLVGSGGQPILTWDLSRSSDSAADSREYLFTGTARLNYGHLNLVFPKGMAAADGVWKVTAGSAYAAYVSGPVGTALAAGAEISCASFPSGTFVKRIFNDGNIELSAEASISDDTAAVHFNACTSKCSMRMTGTSPILKSTSNWSQLSLTTSGNAAGNDNRLYAKLVPQNGTATGNLNLAGAHPNKATSREVHPRLMLEYGKEWADNDCSFNVVNGYIELQPTNGTNNALYKGKMSLLGESNSGQGWSSTSHWEVPEGRFATIDRVVKVNTSNKNYYGPPSLNKWGAGDLEIKMATDTVNGYFYAREGMLGMTFGTPAPVITEMTVYSNAGLRMNTGANDVTVTKLTLKPTVTLGSVVDEDGVVSCVTISTYGTGGFDNGGKILISGNLKKLKGGDYPLWKCPAITAATAAKWSLQFSDPDHTAAVESLARRSKLVSAAGVLSLHVNNPGLFIVVK